MDPGPLVRGTGLRIRIRIRINTKISRIPNTAVYRTRPSEFEIMDHFRTQFLKKKVSVQDPDKNWNKKKTLYEDDQDTIGP